MAFRYLIVAFFLFFMVQAQAQSEAVKGRITDEETGEALAFVNISFEDGKKGIQSDIDGIFYINTISRIGKLTFSYVGYETKVYKPPYPVIKGALSIQLKRKDIELNEVVVHPGDNPAHRIIERVIENRDKNNPEKLKSFSYQAYNKMHFAYQEDTTFKRTHAYVNPDSLFPDPADKNMRDKMRKHHLFLLESVSHRDYQSPDKNLENVISSKVSGFSDPSFTMLATQMQSFSFYNTFVTLMEKNYLNPISTGSTRKYFFLMKDTFITETMDTLFVVSFKPRRGTNFEGLQGLLYINTNGYALQNVIAGPVNSTDQFAVRIQQQYEFLNHSQWFPTQLNTDLLFKKSKIKTTSHEYYLAGIGKSYLSEVKINPNLDHVKFSNVSLKVANDAYQKKDSIWYTYRPAPLDARDSATYRLVDSLGKAQAFDQKLKLLEALISGYIPWGVFNLDYKQLLNYNDYEGLRLGLGLMTNQKVSRFYSLGGYFSYGFRDKDWKYGSSLQFFPGWQSDTKLTFTYQKDVKEIGGTVFFDDYIMNSSDIYRKIYVNRMDKVEKKEVSFCFRAFSHFKLNLFLNQELKNSPDYLFQGPMADPPTPINKFSFTEIGMNVKFGFREKFVETPTGRKISLGTPFPMVWFNYHRGISALSGNYEYSKYELKLAKSFLWKWGGKSQIQLVAGKVDGSVPLCNLYNSPATFQQLGIEAENSFATMRVNEFFSDEFVSMFFKQSIGSLFFHGASFKPEFSLITNVQYGKMSHPEYHLQLPFKTPDKGYIESGILMDKILSMSFFGYGFGVLYRYGPYGFEAPAKNFAYKISVKFNF